MHCVGERDLPGGLLDVKLFAVEPVLDLFAEDEDASAEADHDAVQREKNAEPEMYLKDGSAKPKTLRRAPPACASALV